MRINDVWMVDSEKQLFGDLYIENGKIVEIIEKTPVEGEIKKVIMPGFIDLHAHFREPGYTHKEDIESGSRAAAKGGYTYVTLMANTNPVCDNMLTLKRVNERAEEVGIVGINQCIAGTKNMEGENISHLKEILSEDVKCISDDGVGVMDGEVMREILSICKQKGWLFMSHAEDKNTDNMRDAENSMTERDVKIAGELKANLHMCHVSTVEAIRAIEEGKKTNPKLTCEVTPHHLINPKGIEHYRVNPPIREAEDVKSIIKGIKDGLVDCIATDHAPHTQEDKKNGSPGISGIEYSFAISYTTLVREDEVDLKKLSNLMSGKPAEILGLKKGKLKEGFDGDIVEVVLDEKITVSEEDMVSRGKNTPLMGREFYGVVERTIKGGKVAYRRERDDNR